MVNVFSNLKFNSFVVFLLLLSFAFRGPAEAYGLSDAALTIRMTTLISKAKKYQKKNDEKGLIKTMFEIKSEVEGYVGRKISLNKMIDQVSKDAAKSGRPIRKDHLQAYKNKFKAVEKKNKTKSKQGWFYGKGSEKDPRKKESPVFVPVRISIGITLVLVGGFLGMIPIPQCKVAGGFLATAGFTQLLEGYVELEKENEQGKRQPNAS